MAEQTDEADTKQEHGRGFGHRRYGRLKLKGLDKGSESEERRGNRRAAGECLTTHDGVNHAPRAPMAPE